MKVIHQLVSSIAILSLTACASAPKSSVPADFRGETSTLQVLAMADPQELKAQFVGSTSGASGGAAVAGLAGMALGSAFDRAENKKRAIEADAKVAPFRSMLGEFDFHTQLSNSIQTQINQTSWGDSTAINTVVDSEIFRATDYLATIDEDYLIVLRTKYSLSPDFSVLAIGVLLSLHDNLGGKIKNSSARIVNEAYIQYQSKSLNPKWRLLTTEEVEEVNSSITKEYNRKISDASVSARKFWEKEKQEKLSKVGIKTKEVETPAGILADNKAWNNELLITEIQQGIEQISRLVVIHLNDQRTGQEYKALERRIPVITQTGAPNPYGLTAYEFTQFSDATVYRTKEGELYCVPSGEILQKRAHIQ